MINTVRAGERRRTENPERHDDDPGLRDAGDTDGLSMWQVEMAGGSRGPRHVFDSEQVWTVLEGELTVELAGEERKLGAGDTVVLPSGAERQLTARTDVHLLVCGRSDAIVRVPGEDAPRGTPPWIA
jgi:quercetin dioxygenase-like cupin family protein